MKFQIKNYFSGSVQAEVEIAAIFENEILSVQLGAAVKAAYKSGAYLKGAYLTGAYLKGADLKGAYLTGAYLKGAYLKGAYLTGAYLKGADLTGADLTGADLKGAYLTGAYLKGAYLTGAYLKGAYLTGAYLKGADLKGADLTGADLTGADLTGAVNLAGAVVGGEPLAHATPEQSIANLDKVREIILDNESRLDMGVWHRDGGWEKRTCAEEAVCGTAHCMAGWLQVCATDPKVRELDPHIAGIVQAPVAAKMFLRSNREALEWLKERKYVEEAKDYA